jgi:hypothetical protein
MSRPAPDIDVIMDILQAVLKEQPGSVFVNSLYQQYRERGGLSKKQLEGLHSKASKLESISSGKLATLQAIILKKPTRYRSELPTLKAPVKDNTIIKTMEEILEKYPLHKRLLFLKSKSDNNEILTAAEISEIEKFRKLLL